MFWRKKLAHSRRAVVPRAVLQNPELDWQFYAALSQRNSYDTNLIKNGCGELVEVPTLSLTEIQDMLFCFIAVLIILLK
jgi:hypothetical protein